MNITIRPETRSDYPVISQINDLAFGRENEGELIERLRKKPDFLKDLSLLALFDGQPVGHILFYPITITGKEKQSKVLALAPMSVMPEFQGLGIGSSLIEKGLLKAKGLGYKAVIVLGHKEYYPRFGFQPASKWEIKAPFETPDENFMALNLEEGYLETAPGIVEYPREFLEA